MLDRYVRSIFNPIVDKIGKNLDKLGLKANQITMVGFICGLLMALSIVMARFDLAILFLCLNRLCDTFDGAVARIYGVTDFGGFFDIIVDFVIYSLFVLSFAIYDQNNAVTASFLLCCYVSTTSSFLAYAIIAAKRSKQTSVRGNKSFYYLGGICEGTETFIFMFILCVLPKSFILIASIYGFLCIITTMGRIYAAYLDFG